MTDPTTSAAKTNVQLGVANLQQGNYPLAREKLERSLKQNPKDKLDFHGLNAGFTFEALLIAADAYKRSKSTDPKVLAEAIRQTNITEKMTLGGPIKFNEKGQVEGIGSACVQNLNLMPTVVLPQSAAKAKPVFPAPYYKKA